MDREAIKRDALPMRQPITNICSRSDAIVDWRAARDKVSPNVERIQVNVSHLRERFRLTNLVTDCECF